MLAKELIQDARNSWWDNENCSGGLPSEKIYECGYIAGYNRAQKEMNETGLALQSDMDKTVEQNVILKKNVNELTEKKAELEKDVAYLDEMLQEQIEATLRLYKVNKWHYPSKGDFPGKGKEVLIYTNQLGLIFGKLSEDRNSLQTYSKHKFSTKEIIAWKEITPPKEIEREDW